jgi:hypothetical protein
MANTAKVSRENIRTTYMEKVRDYLSGNGEEVLQVGSNEYAIPVVRDDGEDDYIVLTFKMPIGSRDGDPYDGYSLANDYAFKCEERKKKAETSRLAKEKKIAKDKAMREAKAKARKEREGE